MSTSVPLFPVPSSPPNMSPDWLDRFWKSVRDLDKRVTALEALAESHAETLTDHEARIDELENP